MSGFSAACLGMVLLTAWFIAQPLQAQDHRVIPMDDASYQYIARLQRRGFLLSLNPTALPYTRQAVAHAISIDSVKARSEAERGWFRWLHAYLSPSHPESGAIGFEAEGGVRAANSRRLDVLRPIGQAVRPFPFVSARVFATSPVVVGEAGLRHDLYYDRDPDGLDVARRLMTRPQHSYVGITAAPVSAFLGRFQRHWGPYGGAALVLSDNARSFDHVSFGLKRGPLELTSLLGELDSIDPEGRFTGEAYLPGSRRRYLAAHRLDWRPKPSLTLTLMEGVLYSGENSGVSLKYLNPLLLFVTETDNRPKNDQNNLLLAASLWFNHKGVTANAQFLLDDFVYESSYPMRLALTGGLNYAGLSDVVDVGASFELIGSETYNTFQPEGRYLYLNRGLGTQFSDYLRVTSYADVFLDRVSPGLALQPYAEVLFQGERDMRLPIPGIDEADWFLHGRLQRTIRTAARITLLPLRRWWLIADLGMNMESESARDKVNHMRFSGMISAGVRYNMARPVQ